jgi:hypothetical protein
MARIPIMGINETGARPVGTPYVSGPSGDDSAAVARGVREAGAALGNIGSEVARQIGAESNKRDEATRRAKHRADVVAANNALTGLQHDLNSSMYGDAQAARAPDAEWAGMPGDRPAARGFLAERGQSAAATSVPTLEWQEKRRQHWGSQLKTPEQRALFEAESTKLRESYRVQVERHTTGQIREAEEASVKAREETALREVANNYADEATVRQQVAGAVGPMSALALSKEDADAKVAALESKVAQVRLERYLGDSDWKGAEQLFERDKAKLGAAASTYEKRIGDVKRIAVASQVAADATAVSVDERGRVDLGLALERAEALAGDDPLVRKEVRAQVHERALRAEQSYDADTERLSKQAHAIFNERGFAGIPPALKAQLNERNPALYERLKDDAERKVRQRRSDVADQRRQQSEANTLAMQDFMARPADERATLDISSTYAGSGANAVGMGALKVKQREAVDSVTRGEAASETEFVRQAKAAAAGIVTGKDAGKLLEAEAALAFSDFVQRNKRKPTREEMDAEIAGLVEKQMVGERRLFGLLDPKEERGFETRAKARKEGSPAAPATPPAAKVEVLGPGGARKAVPADRLDAWLAGNPGWKRR